MQIAALAVFFITYILLLAVPKFRAFIALGSAAVFVILFLIFKLPVVNLIKAVNWNVIMMIGGTMGTVSLFIASKMPDKMADGIIKHMPDVRWTIIALALFAGLVSAFIDNVATVLIVAPIALTISKKLNISPVKSIIAIAISSNLQGAATLVGDTTSILLGGYANMDFLDFFVFDGRVGMFFIVQAGALVSALVLLFLFRKEKTKIKLDETTEVKDKFPTILLMLNLLLLIGASFIPNKPDITNGLICVGIMLIGLVREIIKRKDIKVAKAFLKEIDFFTLLLLFGLFMVIGALTEVGIISKAAELIKSASGGNVFVTYTILVWVSVLLSAFIDNIPYVATMLPIASLLVPAGVDPAVLYLGLLCGATLGGNITPIGASANITGLGILRKNGYEVKALDFMKISVPFTLAAVCTGYGLIWLFYYVI